MSEKTTRTISKKKSNATGSKKQKPKMVQKKKSKEDIEELELRMRTELEKKLESCDATDIIYEDINDDYAYGYLGIVKLIICKEDGYGNVTKMCADIGTTKEFRKWKCLNSTPGMLRYMSKRTGVPEDDLIRDEPNLPNHLKGTYAHPKLIPIIASWVSKIFSVMVSDIVYKFFSDHVDETKDKIIKEQKKLIKEKDEKINELMKMTMENGKKMDHLIKEDKKNKKILNNQTKIMDDLRRNDVKMMAKMTSMHSMLKEKAARHIKPTARNNDKHVFIIIETNYKMQNPKHTFFKGDYYVMRIMIKSMASLINRIILRHPYMKILSNIYDTSNSMNLWHHMRDNYTEGDNVMIKVLTQNKSCNYFNVVNGYTITDVINAVKGQLGSRLDGIPDLDDLCDDDASEEDCDDIEEMEEPDEEDPLPVKTKPKKKPIVIEESETEEDDEESEEAPLSVKAKVKPIIEYDSESEEDESDDDDLRLKPKKGNRKK